MTTSCRPTLERVLFANCSAFMHNQEVERVERIARNNWSDIYVRCVALGMSCGTLPLTEDRILCARDLIRREHPKLLVDLVMLILSYLPISLTRS